MKRIFSFILALMAVQMMFAQITVFRVTNTDDSGEGSLRDAVNIVNALKEETTDSFRIVLISRLMKNMSLHLNLSFI